MGPLLSNRLTRNVGANLMGGAWNGLLIVMATPWYVSLLSLEGYGLLGFWLLMQMVLSLFDLGLGATLVREFADPDVQGDDGNRRRDLLRTLEYVYWIVALCLTAIMFVSADWIASHWLRLHVFPADQVANAIKLMAMALGLQYPGALYSSGLAGLQRQGRMNALQMVGNTARYGGGVAILLWKADPVWFFGVQALVAASQTLATRHVLWHMLPGAGKQHPSFQTRSLQRVWRFSAGMAGTMIVSVLLANVDRLFLSRFMPAAELGKYALAFTATGLIQMGIQPFYRAYFPRFAELVATGASSELRMEYYQGCRLVAAIVLPVSVVGWAFAPAIFTVWIGHADATVVAVFRWLLIGIAGAGLMWLPAAYQQAHGWTRLHAAMIAGALVIGVPSLLWTTRQWGTVGATAVWVLHGVSDVTLGLWLMHRRLLRGELSLWYRKVVVPPLLCSLPLVACSWWIMPSELSPWVAAAWVGVTSLLVSLLTLFGVMLKRLDLGHATFPRPA